MKGRARSIRVDGRCGEGRPARRGSACMHSRVGFCWLLGPFPAPPGPKAAMRTGLVGSVGRLCGSALCGGHRGDGAALAGRRGRVVCRLLCRKMGGGARGARIRCSEGGRRCWRCGGMAWGLWRMQTTEYTNGDVRANLGGHPAPRPPGDRHCHWPRCSGQGVSKITAPPHLSNHGTKT